MSPSTESRRGDPFARRCIRHRTYFVRGHRVDQVRIGHGQSAWACDCEEYARARDHGLEPTCTHSRRVAAMTKFEHARARRLDFLSAGC